LRIDTRQTWTALLAATMATAACSQPGALREEPARPEPPTQAVQTAAVVKAVGGDITLIPAVVAARLRASLAARIPASVVELPRQVGESVQADDVVVRLDDAALRAALQAAETSLAVAAADLSRIESLHGKGAATSRELDRARAQTAGARAAAEAARDSLSYAVLRAPFAGRIASRPTRVGDVVNPGMTLIEIEGAGGLELRASVAASVARSLRPGIELVARVDGLAESLPARVRTIAPAADPSTHRLELKADLPRRAGLRAGLFARLAVPGAEASERILAPASAVFERGGLSGVFVVSQGRAFLRWVAVGEVAGSNVEIRAGLEVGERVVVDPTGLVDDQRVEERG